MSRPAASLLEVRLPCAPGVSDALAMRACLEAAAECGLSIAARSASSIVLLPGITRSLRRCLAPGGALECPQQDEGCGVAAELTSRGGDGLAVSVVASQAARGEAYVAALRARLASLRPTAGGRGAEEGLPPMQRESSAYLLVSKLLCSRQEAPGAFVAAFLQAFAGRFSEPGAASPVSSTKPRAAMAECRAAIDKLRGLVEKALHGKGMSCPVLPEELAPLLHTTVERCVFARVGPMLWRYYVSWHRDEDDRYVRKALALSRLSDGLLLGALEVNAAFCGLALGTSPTCKHKVLDLGVNDRSFSPLQTIEPAAAETGGTAEVIPSTACEVGAAMHHYERASAALMQVETALQHGGTPPKAMEALSDAQLEMKACAFEASSGQADLCSMDDILPLFVFVLLKSRLRCPLACAALLRDALSPDQRVGSEGRAALLLESAARYIADEWDVSELLA